MNSNLQPGLMHIFEISIVFDNNNNNNNNIKIYSVQIP